MSDQSFLEELFKQVTVGDEYHDPAEGDHMAELQEVNFGANSNGTYAALLKWVWEDEDSGMMDVTDRLNIPEPHSEMIQKSIFLSNLHTLKVIPESEKRLLMAADEKEAMALIEAISQQAGGQHFSIRVKTEGGFRRVRILKQKQSRRPRSGVYDD